MSQPQQWTAAPAGSGSVKRARERAMAGSTSDKQAPPAQRPYDGASTRPGDSPPRSRHQMPAALADTRAAQGPIGVAISKPTQVPQWPLTGNTDPSSDQRPPANPQYQPPAGRGAPPQRPPRPSNVPSILDASKIQEPTQSFSYRHQQQDPSQLSQDQLLNPQEDNISPASPMTLSSRPSTVSSVGTIPDFPIPAMPPGPPRRSANLGPPPTSRRGGTSFYSQSSFVSPIPEESPRTTSHVSYASSAAIPTSWGSASPASPAASPGYEYDEFQDVERTGDGPVEEGRESRESNMDDNDEKALVRSASLGKRAKPSVIMNKGIERTDGSRPGSLSRQQSGKRVSVDTKAAQSSATGPTKNGEIVWPMLGSPDSSFTSGTTFIDKSTSSSDNEVPREARFESKPRGDDTPSSKSDRASQILGAYQAASSLQPRGLEPSRTPSPFSRFSALRRPPRLDIDAVRDAEARGSLTSLPDLIRRATRLAAMMDRGKRPASRLNELNDFALYNDMAMEKEMRSSPDNRQSGLSGMLAAFPPPGLATPVRNQAPRPVSSWPQISDPQVEQRGLEPRKQRRCFCGLPAWAACLLLLLILVIIAAAVVVPLEILVIHKKKSTTTAVSPLTQCQRNITCANGGTNVVNSGSCSCLCTNGFTGSTCTIAGATGCTTTDISSAITNVTIGEAIPRLVMQAQQNFSVPLFPTIILAEFNDASLSCASENALVTFDGISVRRALVNGAVAPKPSKASLFLERRQSQAYASTPPAATENGIVYDPDPSPTVYTPTHSYTSATSTSSSTSSRTRSPTATTPANATPASAIPTPSSTNFIITPEVLDFARVAVLFILQQENLDSAVTAQGSLQHFFSQEGVTNSAASNITVGNGNVVNLSGLNLMISNGTHYGKGV
ncbi:hypothetical protein B7463_g10834, partial [Scytalidium lignicola]